MMKECARKEAKLRYAEDGPYAGLQRSAFVEGASWMSVMEADESLRRSECGKKLTILKARELLDFFLPEQEYALSDGATRTKKEFIDGIISILTDIS